MPHARPPDRHADERSFPVPSDHDRLNPYPTSDARGHPISRYRTDWPPPFQEPKLRNQDFRHSRRRDLDADTHYPQPRPITRSGQVSPAKAKTRHNGRPICGCRTSRNEVRCSPDCTARESAAVALSRIVATEVRTEFAPDSPLEGSGFELLVPQFSSCCARPAFLSRISTRLGKELDGFRRSPHFRQGHR